MYNRCINDVGGETEIEILDGSMKGPRLRHYLYNRWLFLVIGLAGLGNVALLIYRFAVLGLLSHEAEHIAAAVFSLVTFVLAFAIFIDLTLRKPGSSK